MKKLIKEQAELAKLIRQKTGVNIVTCGNCGAIVLHDVKKEECLECHDCHSMMGLCDCPDLFYDDMEAQDESEERSQLDFPPILQDAIDNLTIELFNDLDYGDEVCLNDEYTIYHYAEDEIVVINRVKNDDGEDDWTEVLQVMTDGTNFTFEVL
jgi:hypothetical protein